MSHADEDQPDVGALAINVGVPEHLRWTDTRRDQEFELRSITVRLLDDGSLAAKAYGRPVGGGRGGYTSFPVPDDSRLHRLVEQAATRAAERWARHRGLLPRTPDG